MHHTMGHRIPAAALVPHAACASCSTYSHMLMQLYLDAYRKLHTSCSARLAAAAGPALLLLRNPFLLCSSSCMGAFPAQTSVFGLNFSGKQGHHTPVSSSGWVVEAISSHMPSYQAAAAAWLPVYKGLPLWRVYHVKARRCCELALSSHNYCVAC